MPWKIETHRRGVLLNVKAVPGGHKNELRLGKDGELRAVVTQVAEQGRANAAVIALLAKSLGVRKSQLEILRGTTSKSKTVLVIDCTAATLSRTLDKAVGLS